MTKKKEKKDLIATSNDLLIKAQLPRLNIHEQRLVLYMLYSIHKKDKDFKTFRISIRELRNLEPNCKDIYKRYDEATDGLMSKKIEWIDKTKKNNKHKKKVAWCSYAGMVPGEGYVEMRVDPALKPFLLELSGNFTSWGERRSVIGLKNHYSLRLYQLIKYHQGLSELDGRKSAVVKLDWLKNYLAIPEGQYNLFGHLKSRVLQPSKKDIEKNTDIEIFFTGIKEGRKIAQIEFSWKSNNRFKQQELPGMDNLKGSSVLDILISEFGVKPEKEAVKIIQQYDEARILEALESVREYKEERERKGETVRNIGGLARKSIEQGWKPKSSVDKKINKQKQLEQKLKEEQKRLENLRTDYDFFRVEELKKSFKKLPADEQEELKLEAESIVQKENENIPAIALKKIVQVEIGKLVEKKVNFPNFEEWKKQQAL